jgi:sensor histidine kinase YesM
MEFTELYLAIQEARLGDRLTVHTDVQAAALPVEVPNQVLQPLVENAFRHGVAARPGPVRVEIRAGVADGSLIIEVEDNGPGPTHG